MSKDLEKFYQAAGAMGCPKFRVCFIKEPGELMSRKI
jgi:hypothetical protein